MGLLIYSFLTTTGYCLSAGVIGSRRSSTCCVGGHSDLEQGWYNASTIVDLLGVVSKC